jgi:hypothetical protein
MKKFCLVLTLGTILSLSAIAQDASDLKPFKCDVSFGYAIPGGSGSKGGILCVVEPNMVDEYQYFRLSYGRVQWLPVLAAV